MASNPGMVVRIAANLQELRKNLAEGKNQVETTTAAMGKLATSFQGDRIVQAAHNAAAAIQQIGGVSKLTEAEQARVNATVTKALAKYQALGKEAPQALRQLAEDTKRADTSSKSWASNLDSFLAGAVAGLTVKVIELGQQLLISAVRGIGEFVRRGGDVAAMSKSFQALSGGVDQANARIGAIRTATSGLIDNFSIMQATNKAMLLGLNLSSGQMAELARTATVLGRAMGQDAGKSLDDLIIALGRTSPMILDNLGLSVKVGEANQKYAAALGKTADALSDAEKKQAFMNAAMDAARDKVAIIGGVHLTAADRISQMWTAIKNVTDATASWFVSLGPVNTALDKFVTSLQTWEALLRGGPKEALEQYKQSTNEIPPVVAEVTDSWIKAATKLDDVSMSEAEVDRVTKQLTETVKANIDVSKKFNDELRKFGGADALSGARDMLGVLQGIGGPLKVLPSQLESMAKQFEAAAEAARLMGDLDLADQYDALAKTLTPVVQFQQRYNVTIGEFVTLNPSFSGAIREQASLFEKQADVIHIGVIPNLMDMTDLWVGFKEKVYEDDPSEVTENWADSIDDLAQSLSQMADVSGDSFGGIVRDIATIVTAMNAAHKSATSLKQGLSQLGSGNTMSGVTNAASGAAGAFTAMASATSSTSMATNVLGGALTGAQIGSIIPGIGTAVGAAAGALIGFARSLGRVSKEVKEARKTLVEFEQELWNTLTAAQVVQAEGEPWKATVIAVRDAYIALGRSEQEALAAVEGMWDTDNPQRSAAAIAEVSAAFQQLEADNERLTAAMDKYGLSVEDMGHKFKQTQINTTAGEFIEDFRVLAGAVDDVNVVLNKMAPEVNEFINSTIAMGGQVPLEMQGIIAKQIEMGLLFDENGKAITDLTQIPFAASLTDSLSLIVDRLDDLIERIAFELPRAIQNVPDVNFDLRGNLIMPDLPHGVEIEGFARGTGGMRDFGPGTLAVLHGREEVRTEEQKRADEQAPAFASEIPGGSDPELKAMLRQLPRQIGQQMRWAIQAEGGL